MGSKEGSSRPWSDQDNRIESGEANTPPHRSDARISNMTLDICRRCHEGEATHLTDNAVCRAFEPMTVVDVEKFEAEQREMALGWGDDCLDRAADEADIAAAETSGVADPDQVERFRTLGERATLATYGRLGVDGWMRRSAERQGERYRRRSDS